MEMIHTLGRRKTAVARIHMTSGEGKVIINGKESRELAPYPCMDVKPESLRETCKEIICWLEKEGK